MSESVQNILKQDIIDYVERHSPTIKYSDEDGFRDYILYATFIDNNIPVDNLLRDLIFFL